MSPTKTMLRLATLEARCRLLPQVHVNNYETAAALAQHYEAELTAVADELAEIRAHVVGREDGENVADTQG